MSAPVVCAVAWAVPADYWVSYVCSDLTLCLFAALAYLALAHSRQRSSSKAVSAKNASLASCGDLDHKPCFQHAGIATVCELQSHDESEPIAFEQPEEYQFDSVDLKEAPSGEGDLQITTDSDEPKETELQDTLETELQEKEWKEYIAQEEREYIAQVNTMIEFMSKYALEGNISGTMRTFRLIKQSGTCLNSLMYNTVLQAWINGGDIQGAEDWLEEIIGAGMADEASFIILMKAHVAARAMNKAQVLLKDMRAKANQEPSIATFNELLNGCAQEGLLSEGMSLVEEMDKEGLQPTSFTLDTIVQLMNSSRNTDQSCSRIHEILHKYIAKFDVNEYDAQVNALVEFMQKYALEGNISRTMRTFKMIKRSGTCLNSLMYNTVLRAWINCGNVHAAEDWLEEIIEAGMADETSFNILMKALVTARAMDKAQALLQAMRDASQEPSIVTFNELLNGLAQEGLLDEGLSLLEEMHAEGVQPTCCTLDSIVKLMNSSRSIDQSCNRIHEILQMYQVEPSQISPVVISLPRLASVISKANDSTSRLWAHEVHASGSLAQVKALRKNLKQQGYFDQDESSLWPLNGRWETEHGLTVIIEGKMVRWSQQRASRLHFTAKDRSTCMLTLYGEATQGQLVQPTNAPGATKALRWANGDIWHSYDCFVIGETTLSSQSMTKALRDVPQDEAYRSRSDSVLKSVSKFRLGLPSVIEDALIGFLGNNMYHMHVLFESKWSPSSADAGEEADIFQTLSCRHPRIGLRHCWAEQSSGLCSQRTLVNGEEANEDIFNRHIKAVWKI